jgi:hydroxymethylglutaryl-CoA lyase
MVGPVPTASKVALIDALSLCGLREIEVGSFVSPLAMPQMADTAEVAVGITRVEGVAYRAPYFNGRGAQRALATGRLDVEGSVSVCPSDGFAMANLGRSSAELLADVPVRLEELAELGLEFDTLGVMAAFGCNYVGAITQADVVEQVEEVLRRAGGRVPRTIVLADTMGWAIPTQIGPLVAAVSACAPGASVRLHLHDTRGLAMANALAALEAGVTDFETAVGGVGGCPFAGSPEAAGNLATEDFTALCDELGVSTGVDVDGMIDTARRAEHDLGLKLFGRVVRAGSLASIRRAIA